MINLKASEKEKTKKWYKEFADYILPNKLQVNEDYEEMKMCYEVSNGDLTSLSKKIDDFLNPMGEDLYDIKKEQFETFPFLHNFINELKGELIKRNDDYKIVLLSAQAIRNKNQKLQEALKASVDEELMIVLEKQKARMEGMSEEEINQYVEELRTQLSPEDIAKKDFLADQEIFYNKALEYCRSTEDIKTKKIETLEDVINTDRCFIYSGWKFGKPSIQIRNPLFTDFDKSPNTKYVNKGDYVVYRQAITLADAYTNYEHLLDDEELKKLKTYQDSSIYNKAHGLGLPESDFVFKNRDIDLFDDLVRTGNTIVNDKRIGLHQTNSNTRASRNKTLIWETHFEFKAFRKSIFLSYQDEYNKTVTVVLSDKFEIPKEAEKVKFTNRYGNESVKFVWYDEIMDIEYTAEELYIPRKYEMIILGEDIIPIYREVPNQHTDIENPYSNFNLSTFGAVFTNRNSKSESMIKRVLPLYLQYLYVKNIQNRELSKYQGAIQSIDIDQIPDELGLDVDGEPIRDKVATYLQYLKRTNKDIYSGSQTSLGGMAPNTRSPGSSGYMLGTAAELMNLQNLLNLITTEMGFAIGIPPQRLAQFSPNSNVSDNRQALAQSFNITEPLFYMLSEVWRQALGDYLINFKTYAEKIFESSPELKEHTLHYIMPDGTKELFKITPNMLTHASMGLFLNNQGKDQMYVQAMMSQVQAFAQNAGEGVESVSTIIKNIANGSSPEETHRQIQVLGEKQRQARLQEQQNMQEQQKQNALAIEKEKQKTQQSKHNFELERINLEKTWDMKIKQIESVSYGADVNENNVPDVLEIEKFKEEVRQNDIQNEQAEKKMKLEEKALEIKKQQAKKTNNK